MANMTGPRQKILMKHYKGSTIKTAILWPLILYGLIQVATNIPNNSSRFQQDSIYISSKNDRGRIQESDDATSSQKLCSSQSKISYQLASSSLLAYLPLLQIFNQNYYSTIFGGKILMAEATSSLYQPNQDKGIIILNSTNFNTELIQHKHPFPHVKLIEYYVSFCGFCAKFKTTYTKLAKEIYPWRNVIRPSAIDLGVSTNSPIAHSWSVEVVPTLRIHPPPNPSLAEKLDKQLSSWNSTLSPSELQKSMFEEYNSSHLMIHSLGVAKYMEKVPLLKSDLLLYIERYVRESPTELPASWPNLRPISETSLAELRHSHPRQELFLIIEGPTLTSQLDQSSSTEPVSLGLSIMMELSSSAPWKAIRYVRASENRPFIEDVIAQQKKTSEQSANEIVEQVELLNNFLSNKSVGRNNILLVHIDNSHSPFMIRGSTSAFPFMTIVTGMDLVTMERSVIFEEQNQGSYKNRAKKSIDDKRNRRSLSSSPDVSQLDKMSTERKIELYTLYIKQTYTDTSEDRDFVKAINNIDENSKSDETLDDPNKAIDTFIKTQQMNSNRPTNSLKRDLDLASQDKYSMLNKVYEIFNPPDSKQKVELSSYSTPNDYDDKLKAIRYMLFNEIPRASIIDKSLVEQQEKLNTLVNLFTVIKSYFPFHDSSSIQFIDEVLSYLMKQQSRLSSINTQERGNSGFDTRAFKQELKRIESEDKRLPEIKEWKHCKDTGYPCAIWRLFHTLVAFEFKKLNQIRQLSLPPPSTGLQQSDNISPSVEAITMKSTNSNAPSPVERLVSPPSTTPSLSLTIATPTSSQTSDSSTTNNKPLTEADLPTPVLLVMRDYITTFFSCVECAKNYRIETADLSLEKIRSQPAEFSILWLWETHNRVNKRLSVDPEANPKEHPKVWFPTYDQCTKCYKKPPSFLQDSIVDVTIFQESIEWNKQEVLCFLLGEYTKQPMDNHANLFGYQVPYGLGYIIVTCICCFVLIAVFRCTTHYIERQRRHKATLLNGNGTHQYTLELQ